MSRWHGVAGGTAVGGDVTPSLPAPLLLSAAPLAVAALAVTVPAALNKKAHALFQKNASRSISRWHGVVDGATVGGDVGTVTTEPVATVTVGTATITATATAIGTVTTVNRAARYFGVSDDSVGGDVCAVIANAITTNRAPVVVMLAATVPAVLAGNALSIFKEGFV